MAHRAFSFTLWLMVLISCLSHLFIIYTFGKDAINLFLPDLTLFMGNEFYSLALHFLLLIITTVSVVLSVCFLAVTFTLMFFTLFHLLLSIKKQILSS